MAESTASILRNSEKTANSHKNKDTAKTMSERIADKIYWVLRCAVVLNIVALFFPSFNPARLSGMINKNLSLFSCGISYKSIVANFGRAFRQGWVLESTFHTLNVCSFIIILAVVVAAAGGCMSLGNRKLKKTGLFVTAAAGVIELAAMIWMKQIYNAVADQAISADKLDRVLPMYPHNNYIYIAFAVILIVCSAVNFVLIPKAEQGERFDMEPKFRLFLMMLPIIALAFVFSYLPLYGWRYAFFDYKSGETLSAENFVGFKWFTSLLQNSATKSDLVNVLKNTLAMSGLGILTSWVPMVFAVFLSEVKNSRFRRIVQTFTTIPNFISWVRFTLLRLRSSQQTALSTP